MTEINSHTTDKAKSNGNSFKAVVILLLLAVVGTTGYYCFYSQPLQYKALINEQKHQSDMIQTQIDMQKKAYRCEFGRTLSGTPIKDSTVGNFCNYF